MLFGTDSCLEQMSVFDTRRVTHASLLRCICHHCLPSWIATVQFCNELFCLTARVLPGWKRYGFSIPSHVFFYLPFLNIYIILLSFSLPFFKPHPTFTLFILYFLFLDTKKIFFCHFYYNIIIIIIIIHLHPVLSSCDFPPFYIFLFFFSFLRPPLPFTFSPSCPIFFTVSLLFLFSSCQNPSGRWGSRRGSWRGVETGHSTAPWQERSRNFEMMFVFLRR